jgi:hypothetical protein
MLSSLLSSLCDSDTFHVHARPPINDVLTNNRSRPGLPDCQSTDKTSASLSSKALVATSCVVAYLSEQVSLHLPFNRLPQAAASCGTVIVKVSSPDDLDPSGDLEPGQGRIIQNKEWEECWAQRSV